MFLNTLIKRSLEKNVATEKKLRHFILNDICIQVTYTNVCEEQLHAHNNMNKIQK